MVSQRRSLAPEHQVKLVEVLEMVKLAEQKTKEMAEFAAKIQEKYRQNQTDQA